jgi:Ca2+-binding EF-hand superfamily protein
VCLIRSSFSELLLFIAPAVLGMDSAEKDANEMMAEADLNGDGVISFEGKLVRIPQEQ